jgi:prepilin-type N-terminal cleavage/methylation domain-containing protein
MSKIFGFTLAEVLITIAVVGVVAAMTIPSLMMSYKRRVLETQFKKAYSQLNSAIKLMQEEETEDLYGTYYKHGGELQKAFYKYLKGSYFKGTQKPYYISTKGSTQGMYYCIASCCGNPANSGAFVTFDNIMYYTCAHDDGILRFTFDINGNDKGPNKWGVDLFDYHISSDNVLGVKYFAYVDCCAYFHKKCTQYRDGGRCSYYAMKDKDYFKKIDL